MTFDEQLTDIENQERLTIEQMEPLPEDFCRAAISTVQKYYDQMRDAVIEHNPTQVRRLNDTGELARMKSEFTDVRTRIPELLIKHLGEANIWVHRARGLNRQNLSAKSYESGRTHPVFLGSGYRELHTELSNVFQRYKLEVATSGSWFFDATEAQTVLRRYQQYVAKLEEMSKRKTQIEEAKNKSIASELWDKA